MKIEICNYAIVTSYILFFSCFLLTYTQSMRKNERKEKKNVEVNFVLKKLTASYECRANAHITNRNKDEYLVIYIYS